MAKIETPKKTPAVAATVAPDFSALTLDFAHGKQLVVKVSHLSPQISAFALLHGLKQKLVDAAAISCNPETGRPATVEDKYEAVAEVFDRLMAGDWNKPRESAGAVAGGLLFKALCRMYDTKTPEYIREFLGKKTDAEKAALRKNPRVASIIETIKAENEKEIDATATDAILDELAGLDD